MVNTKFKTTEEMIHILSHLKRKTKLKFHQNISTCHDEMKYSRQNGSL